MNDEYLKRLNKVLEHIEGNLEADLSLEKVSKIACYSPFHLHRLFKAVTGEPLNSYVIRKRTERSAMMLVHEKNLSIAEIAVCCGFNSQTSFSRTFRKVYGQSPSQFRKSKPHNFSKIGQAKSKNGKMSAMNGAYLRNIRDLKNWIHMNAKIDIKELPERQLAYLTQIGENGIEDTFLKMIAWARTRGILQSENSHICRVFHDSFKVTDADKVRMSIGVLTDKLIPVEGKVGLMKLKGGRTIVGHFRITLEEFEQAWNSLFVWMSSNGYKKAGREPFEVYHTDYRDDPEGKCEVDLCIPVD
jgi:AraC family transcriptional regulator